MQRLWLEVSALFCGEEGATATEYAIMLVLILMAAFVAIGVLGFQVDQAFDAFVRVFSAAAA